MKKWKRNVKALNYSRYSANKKCGEVYNLGVWGLKFIVVIDVAVELGVSMWLSIDYRLLSVRGATVGFGDLVGLLVTRTKTKLRDSFSCTSIFIRRGAKRGKGTFELSRVESYWILNDKKREREFRISTNWHHCKQQWYHQITHHTS